MRVQAHHFQKPPIYRRSLDVERSVPAAVSDNCPILPFLQTPLGGYNRVGTPPPPITLIAGILQQLSHPRSRPEVTAKAHAPQFRLPS